MDDHATDVRGVMAVGEDRSATGPLPVSPPRRPTDRAFLAIVDGAFAERPAPGRRRPYRTGPTAGDVALVVVAALFVVIGLVVSVGVAVAEAGPTVDPAALRPSCAAVHYVVASVNAPAGGRPLVRQAFAQLADATGLVFVDDTDGAPANGQRPGRQPVAVAWARRDAPLWLEHPGQVGLATAQWDAAGALVSGVVQLNAGYTLPVSFATRNSWGGVLMHELGHLMGLAHSTDRAEMMYPSVTSGPAEWGPLDRQLLRAAGARLGCPPPPPR